MINKIFLIIVIIYNIFIFYITLSLAKEIVIKNDSENFYNIRNIFAENQNDGQLILNFIDDYYDFSILCHDKSYDINIDVASNITFNGNINGTVFDNNKSRNGKIILNFYKNNGNVVKFQNITFQNYYEDINVFGVPMIIVFAKTDNFLVKIENCNFINNFYPLLYLDVSYNIETNKEPFYIVDNCNF